MRVVADAIIDGKTPDLRAIAASNGLPLSVVRRAAAQFDQGGVAGAALG